MSVEYIPGTVLLKKDYPEGIVGLYRLLISGAGGLTLSQVCEITGLEGSTVQNWVKRGLVAKTVSNKYKERQLSRILIINALRQSMQLDRIVALLAYLNGSVEDSGDDIISESRLLNYLCRIMDQWAQNSELSVLKLSGIVNDVISDYEGCKEWKIKLKSALEIMSLACAASKLRDMSDALYKKTV